MQGRSLNYQSVEQKHGSHSWNAIIKIWPLVYQGVKMAVLSGLGTRFWQDIWLLDKPLTELIQRQLMEGVASRVIWDYTNGGGEWNWHVLNNSFNNDVLAVFIGTEAPEYWSKSALGEFSIKSAYNSICMDM